MLKSNTQRREHLGYNGVSTFYSVTHCLHCIFHTMVMMPLFYTGYVKALGSPGNTIGNSLRGYECASVD